MNQFAILLLAVTLGLAAPSFAADTKAPAAPAAASASAKQK